MSHKYTLCDHLDVKDRIEATRAELKAAQGAPKADLDSLWAELKSIESEWQSIEEEQAGELDVRIDAVADAFEQARHGDATWSEVWSEVRAIREAFKSVRYCSRDARAAAWSRFQGIVDRMAADRRERESRSEELAREIRNTAPTIVTLRISPGDEEDELRHWSDELRDAWTLFHEQKDDLLPKDKSGVYRELKEAQEELDERWAEHKEAKRAAWRERVEANLAKNRDRLADLRAKEARMSEHASELEAKIADAWSEGFRERAEGWLEELEEKLVSLREHIGRVEGWIEEDEDKLSE